MWHKLNTKEKDVNWEGVLENLGRRVKEGKELLGTSVNFTTREKSKEVGTRDLMSKGQSRGLVGPGIRKKYRQET